MLITQGRASILFLQKKRDINGSYNEVVALLFNFGTKQRADEYFDQGDCAHIIIVTDAHIEIQPYPRAVVLQLPRPQTRLRQVRRRVEGRGNRRILLELRRELLRRLLLLILHRGGQPETIEFVLLDYCIVVYQSRHLGSFAPLNSLYNFFYHFIIFYLL